MDSVIKACFIRELKNRFRCLVEVDGREVMCYVPSSCRFENIISLEGQPVLLKKTLNSANLPYTLFALEARKGLVLLNLSMANQIIADQIQRRIFAFLGKRKTILRETSVAGYKSDIFIQDSNTVIEIKTVLSLDKNACFPSVSSQRSIEQLTSILSLLEAGYKVLYLFVALSPYTKSITIDADEHFTDLFRKCIEKGMLYRACSIKTTEEEAVVNRFIDVTI